MSNAKKKRTEFRIGELFVPRGQELLESPIWEVLTASEWRVVRRFELEWMRRGGPKCDGPLIITFTDLKHNRVRRDAMAPSIRVLSALGLLKVILRGRAGNSEFRQASQYVLTYLPTADCPMPTDEWRQITTIEEAMMIAKGARREGSNSGNYSHEKPNPAPRNGTVCSPETGPRLSPETGPSQSRNGTENSVPKRDHSTRSSPSTALGREAGEGGGTGQGQPEAEGSCDGMAMSAMGEVCVPFADEVEDWPPPPHPGPLPRRLDFPTTPAFFGACAAHEAAEAKWTAWHAVRAARLAATVEAQLPADGVTKH